MHLLYLDDSGSVKNPSEEYVVLGGVSIFETQGYYLSNELDKIAQSIDPSNPKEIEFHASEIFARKTHPWNKLSREEAQGVIKAVLKVVANSSNSTYAFACAIHKKSFSGDDALNLAFEDLCQRFDIYLSRLNAEGERQKGLLILDDSSIAHKFYQNDGVVHGLAHKQRTNQNCMCVACMSRRNNRAITLPFTEQS